MGINCCSNAKEPADITITKPEKNMTSTSQNPIYENNQIKVQNITEQIQDLKQSTENSNSNIIIPNEMNTLNSNSDVNQNTISPLTQKEIDDILNKVNYDNQPQIQQKEIINLENNNINNNVTPNEPKMQQVEKNITQNNNLDIEQMLKLQKPNDINEQNIPKQEQKEIIQPNLNINQNIPKENINNNINIQNNQIQNNIPQNQNVYIQPNLKIIPNIENQTQKIITQNIQTTQNIPNQNQTQKIITQNIQTTQNIPVQSQNQKIIAQNIQTTQNIPNQSQTQKIITHNIQTTQNIPNQSQTQKIITHNIQTIQNNPNQSPNIYIQNVQNIPLQNQIQIQNQNKVIPMEQKIPNTQIIQNTQNVANNSNPQPKTKIEDEIEKYFSSQQNQVINNTPNLNIEELLNTQNNQNQTQNISNNNKYIDDLLKNTSSNQTVPTNNDVNFDVFFNQGGDIKIDDALIDKLFESAGKPAIQPQVQKQNINEINQDPLYMTQKFNPNQNLGNLNNNNYFSPVNSPQRSEISDPGSFNYKQFYSIK